VSSIEPKHFPAVCSAAHRPFLTALVGANGEALSPRCPTCGAAARIIPGPCYGARDQERFERIVDIALGVEIPTAQARATLTVLDGLIRKPEAELRRGLLTVLNAESLAAFDASDREELISFLSLLSGLLSVRSEAIAPAESTRRRIASMDAADAPTPGAASKTGS